MKNGNKKGAKMTPFTKILRKMILTTPFVRINIWTSLLMRHL